MIQVVCMSTVLPSLVAQLRASLPEAEVMEIEPGSWGSDLAPHHRLLANASVLVPLRGRVDDEVLSLVPRCRLIQQLGAGLDTVDMAAAAARRIPVCNVPSKMGGNAEAVAELALMHLIAAGRGLRTLQRQVEHGDFRVDGGRSLYGKVVCILGFGGIGRALERLLRPFHCRVIAIRERPGTVSSRSGLDIWPQTRMSEALAMADFVVIALPLTSQTRGLIGSAAFKVTKPGVSWVNVARGPIVDQDALTEAIASGQVESAGLDVFRDEPVAIDDPLLALNVVATPHCGGLTDHMMQGTSRVAAVNIRRVLQGKAPRYRIRRP